MRGERERDGAGKNMRKMRKSRCTNVDVSSGMLQNRAPRAMYPQPAWITVWLLVSHSDSCLFVLSRCETSKIL